ncbi:hypothetical protein [Roseofilum casamattae]|uniref:Uncharacterized protein n=1 Tax=Roseofilum casamattae BLCC-M143 TaxID=3022442 RepID=A0ABT7BYI6_9CYAN|nr:hypothetical protein [Roseofilum casamattae]MDJ1184257.1 hypothetical protein [Roseofilum casamattae BLCC-M143]
MTSPSNFLEADALLCELLEKVEEAEGADADFSGGTQQAIGSEAVRGLLQSRVQFGNPGDRLIHLTEATFKNSGSELNPIYRQQMQEQFHFYYMTIAVSLVPERGARFRQLNCQLDFGPKGMQEPIIQTLFPTQQWRSVMSFGVGMEVGLNGDLDWNVGVDSDDLGALSDSLPGEVKSQVGSKDNFQGFITLPSYKYGLGKPEVIATGEGNSICQWRVQDENLQRIGTLRSGIVFKVPQSIDRITLKGKVWAEPNMNWLTADLNDVFYALGHRFKSVLDKPEDNRNQFTRGAIEEWELLLPQSI